jgi:hypothetical protein
MVLKGWISVDGSSGGYSPDQKPGFQQKGLIGIPLPNNSMMVQML